MKAIRVKDFGEAQAMKLEEMPDPKPGPGQVVIAVDAAGVNPVETYIRAGKYPALPKLPYTPGNDAAGLVESVGPNVTRFKIGDRVYVQGSISGTYATKSLSEEKSVHPLPEKISFDQGAAVGIPYMTAYYGLFFRGLAKAGETVLVHGASGGVGIAAVQLARALGMTVFGTAGTDAGRKLARDQGAHQVFDHRAADYLPRILAATGGRGVDLIVELAAHTNLAKDPSVLARQGRVIVIGSRGSIEINPRDWMSRDADMRAMTMMNATDAQTVAAHAAIVAGLENGSLRPIVGKEFALHDAGAAHEQVLKPGAYGKIILKP